MVSIVPIDLQELEEPRNRRQPNSEIGTASLLATSKKVARDVNIKH